MQRRIAMHNAGRLICKATQLDGFRFRDWAALVSHDAPHHQSSLNPCNIYSLLKVVQHLKPMPPIRENNGRCFVKNAKNTRRSTFTSLRTGRRGGGCDGESSSRVVEPIRAEGLYEKKNVGIAYIAQRNFRVATPINREEQILVVIRSDLKSRHPHSRACSLWHTIPGRCCHFSALSFRFRRRRQTFAERVDGTLSNHRLGVSFVAPRRAHVAKCWRSFTYLATLKGIVIGKWGKVVVHFDSPDN